MCRRRRRRYCCCRRLFCSHVIYLLVWHVSTVFAIVATCVPSESYLESVSLHNTNILPSISGNLRPSLEAWLLTTPWVVCGVYVLYFPPRPARIIIIIIIIFIIIIIII